MSVHWGLAATLAVALVALVPPAVHAKKLKNIIPDLYGGDGITLKDLGHDAHFEEAGLQQDLDRLSQEITNQVNLSAPGSAVASFTFDLQEAVFVQTTESLGPTVAERPQTIGQGKINFGFSYTRLDFKRFDGDKLSDQEFTLDHSLPAPEEFENDVVVVDLDIDLTQDLLQFFAAYGITSKWDVGILVPVVHTDIDVHATAKSVNEETAGDTVHVFCEGDDFDDPANADCDEADDSDSGDSWGIGDISLRTKYHFFKAGDFADWTPDLAGFGFVKFASGEEDDWEGTGHTNFDFFLSAAKTFWRITPHANVGFEFTTGPEDLDNFRYIGGADMAVHERVSLSADVVGRRALHQGANVKDLVDFAIGAKVSPWSTLTFLGTVIVPLNRNQGLRTDVTWSLGVEYTF